MDLKGVNGVVCGRALCAGLWSFVPHEQAGLPGKPAAGTATMSWHRAGHASGVSNGFDQEWDMTF